MRRIEPYSLWLGHIGDARDIRALYDQGIEALVDLALNEPLPTIPRELVYCRFPLIDGAGNPTWIISSAILMVESLLQHQRSTLAFCGAGMSRSPLIAAAAMARLRQCSLEAGINIVVSCGPADISPALLSDVEQVLDRMK